MKWISGYENLYYATEDGCIYNYKNNRMLPSLTGYNRVSLWKDGYSKTHLVHRLIALTFLPNPNNLRCVNHKNLNKSDNSVENLEWVSHQENMNHAKLAGVKMGVRKPTISAEKIQLINKLLSENEPVKNIAKAANVSYGLVYERRWWYLKKLNKIV